MNEIIRFKSSYNTGEGFTKLFERLDKKEYSDKNKVIVDFFNIDINKKYNIDLATLIFEYNCELLGVSEKRLEILHSIINTGYFVKKEMNPDQYYCFFRKLLETTDFSLMILDNVYSNFINNENKPKYVVIKPLYFQGNTFHFKKLKSYFTEPVELEKALLEKKNVWEKSSVFIYDLIREDSGFRLSSTEREFDFLELYSDILNKRVSGFV